MIDVEIGRVSDSCGFSVPLVEYVGERDQLLKWSDGKGDQGLAEYRRNKNSLSLDGLPGLPK